MFVHHYHNGEFVSKIDDSFLEPASLLGRFVAAHQPGTYAKLEITRGVGEDRVIDTYEIAAEDNA